MKSFLLTLSVFFICLLQGLMGSNLKSESTNTESSTLGCGYSGGAPCRRGYYYGSGRNYFGYPYGFGYNGCYRRCFNRGFCC